MFMFLSTCSSPLHSELGLYSLMQNIISSRSLWIKVDMHSKEYVLVEHGFKKKKKTDNVIQIKLVQYLRSYKIIMLRLILHAFNLPMYIVHKFIVYI
jgi:hypothetical protein